MQDLTGPKTFLPLIFESAVTDTGHGEKGGGNATNVSDRNQCGVLLNQQATRASQWLTRFK